MVVHILGNPLSEYKFVTLPLNPTEAYISAFNIIVSIPAFALRPTEPETCKLKVNSSF